MGIYLSDLGLPYSVWTAACAVLFPILGAIAVFICLRRASNLKKLITFFVSSALYVISAVFLFETVARAIGIVRYDLIGFMLAIVAGMLYLELCALICGAGIMRKRGITANLIFTVIFFGASAYAIYCTEAGACSVCGTASDGICTAIHRFPLASKLPAAVSSSGAEFVIIAILVLFIAVYFLCFIANKKADEIRSDAIRRRRTTSENEDEEDNKVSIHIERACAFCQYARPLYGDEQNILCDKNGVVNADHVCRAFIYDPLKRAPARPAMPKPDGE